MAGYFLPARLSAANSAGLCICILCILSTGYFHYYNDGICGHYTFFFAIP